MDASFQQLIFFGRLEERKGLLEFVEALNHLAASGTPTFRAAFVGKVVRLYAEAHNGMDSEDFIKSNLNTNVAYSIIKDLGSREAIEFVRKSGKPIVCLTSPSDNFPNAALEMGQIPCRLVVSDTKGFHQTLGLLGRKDGLYWFKPTCSVSLAQAIRAAISDKLAEPRATTAVEVQQLNERLLQQRLDILNAAFATKRKKHAKPPARIKAVIVLSPKRAKFREIQRSLLALAQGSRQSDCIIVAGSHLADGDVHRLKARFPGVIVRRDSVASLQEMLRPVVDHGEPGDCALVMLAGVAVKKEALAKFAAAGACHPALTVSAELVLGRNSRIQPFEAPSVSMLVRANNACGSCVMVSLPFLESIPTLSVDRPALALWLLVLAAAAQGKNVAYLPLPQHSVRPPCLLAIPHPSVPDDLELALLWHYLGCLEIGNWSRRELRNLILSVQQLALGEARGRQAEWKLHNALTELHTANTALYNTQAELQSLYRSKIWKITKPLRLAAGWQQRSDGTS